MNPNKIICQGCEEETTIEELESHPDVEPISINDYVWCPHCRTSKSFTSRQGKTEF